MDSNKQGFPDGVGGIFRICFFGEGLESIHGESMGASKKKENILLISAL